MLYRMKVYGWLDTPAILLFVAGVLAGLALYESAVPQRGEASGSTAFSVASSTVINSDYLSFTTPGTGNRSTFTFSAWVKRTVFGTTQYIFSADGTHSGNNTFWGIYFNTSDNISVTSWATEYSRTKGVFRDPNTWYHVVVMVDTTSSVSTNRIRIFVNGQEQQLQVNVDPGASTLFGVNNASTVTYISGYTSGTSAFSGYIADAYLIDGQALPPSNFGTTDSSGAWRPIAYTGSYGTDGFHLTFGNANRLGLDSSPNANNFATSTGIATSSQSADTPNTNYAVLSPFSNDLYAVSGGAATLSRGNLRYTDANASQWTIGRSWYAIPTTGKWYWEVQVNTVGGSGAPQIGILGIQELLSGAGGNSYVGFYKNGYAYTSAGATYNASVAGSSYSSYTTGDVIGIAYDADNGKLYFSKNGTWQNSGNPGAGTGAIYTGLTAQYTPAISSYGSAVDTFMFGANLPMNGMTYDATAGGYFRYPPTTNSASGFKALSLANYPSASVGPAQSFFNAVTYTGTSTAQSIGGFNFAPDIVWIKATSTTADNGIFDTTRGSGAVLIPNKTNAEAASTTAFTSFDSAGFSLGAFGAFNNPNTTLNGGTILNGGYVAWGWKKSATAGVDIVTYSGTNLADRTVSHSLGVAPDFAIVKSRSATGNWYVWSSSIGGPSAFMLLNSTAASSTSNSPWCTTTCVAGNWNSSTFMVTNNATNNTNAAGTTYVAYLFAKKTGYSDTGMYRGNGSADGPLVYTGFRPRWILFKNGSGSNEWYIFDTARDTINPMSNFLLTTQNSAETVTTYADVLSNGFKIRSSNSAFNGSGNNYIYLAFADLPFITSVASVPFNGNVITTTTNFKRSLYVAGAIAKGSGTFVIDHPLDPKNKLLYHSFVESPDMKNVYDGVATLNGDGEVTIALPDYFLKLNRDYRYLATPIGESMPDLHLRAEVGKRYFGLFGDPVLKISGGAPNGKISWQVTGIRQDPVAQKNPVIVEIDKSQTDIVPKGQYLHPDAYQK